MDQALAPPDQRKNKPPGLAAEQPQQFSQVGPGRGQHRVDGIAGQPGQEASTHPMIALEVADLRFDGAATASAFAFGSRGVLFPLPGNVDSSSAGVTMTAIALVDIRIGNGHACDVFGSG